METASFLELGPAVVHAPPFAAIQIAIAQPLEACSVLVNGTGAGMAGKIALVRDGLCLVATKIANAQAAGASATKSTISGVLINVSPAGAVGVIIYSNVPAVAAATPHCDNPTTVAWDGGYGNCST